MSNRDPLSGFEEQWREWASTDSPINEEQIRKNLPVRLPPRRNRRLRLTLLAAAASLALVLVGVRALYLGGPNGDPAQFRDPSPVVHQLDENVVLFISNDSEPIYIMLADTSVGEGDQS